MTHKSHFPTSGIIAGLAFFSSVALPQIASAQTVIYDNFGAGNSFNLTSSEAIVGADAGDTYEANAMPFTPSGNFTLGLVEVVGQHLVGTNSYTFSIVNDVSGLPGTTVISSGTITGWNISSPTLQSFMASGSVSAGTQYWLVSEPGASDSFGIWSGNNTSDTGTIARSHSPGSWSSQPSAREVFRITSANPSSAPEPGTLAFLVLGGALTLAYAGGSGVLKCARAPSAPSCSRAAGLAFARSPATCLGPQSRKSPRGMDSARTL